MFNAVVGAGFTNQFVEPLAYFVKPAPPRDADTTGDDISDQTPRNPVFLKNRVSHAQISTIDYLAPTVVNQA